jgi:hypothetical protein
VWRRIGTVVQVTTLMPRQPAIAVQHREQLASIHVVDVLRGRRIWRRLRDPRIGSFDRLYDDDVAIVVVNEQPVEQFRRSASLLTAMTLSRDVLMTSPPALYRPPPPQSPGPARPPARQRSSCSVQLLVRVSRSSSIVTAPSSSERGQHLRHFARPIEGAFSLFGGKLHDRLVA